MARRSRQSDPEPIRKQLAELIENFAAELEKADLRVKVLKLVPAFHLLRNLGSSLIAEETPAAIERIIFYLRKYPKKVIHGDELMVVAGISDWPRRVRELRVQQGWAIISGITAKEIAEAEDSGDIEIDGMHLSKIQPDQYVLLDEQQDRDAAHRWLTANSIRKLKNVSVQEKILKFLKSNIGRAVTGEELRYVANDKSEWARRVRELRTEEGWPVVTRTSGRPDLVVGMYVLTDDRQAPTHDRRIPDDVRFLVLERDDYKCRKCGWSHKLANPSDPRKLLEPHHKIHHAKGGENSVDNLITFCNVCHDKIHAQKLLVEEFLDSPVR